MPDRFSDDDLLYDGEESEGRRAPKTLPVWPAIPEMPRAVRLALRSRLRLMRPTDSNFKSARAALAPALFFVDAIRAIDAFGTPAIGFLGSLQNRHSGNKAIQSVMEEIMRAAKFPEPDDPYYGPEKMRPRASQIEP